MRCGSLELQSIENSFCASGSALQAIGDRVSEQGIQCVETRSERLKKDGKPLEPHLARVIDNFGYFLQERPPGGVPERHAKHFMPTVPGEPPSYPTQRYSLSDEHAGGLKKQLRELLEKGFTVPPQSPVAAPVFFAGKHGTLR